MNIKRLIAAIVLGFIFVMASDFLIYDVWLKPTFQGAMEITARMTWIFATQFLFVFTFILLWAKGFADRNCIVCAMMYGLFMGLFWEANTIAIVTWSLSLPTVNMGLVMWVFSGLVQTILLGIISFLIYKPLPTSSQKT